MHKKNNAKEKKQSNQAITEQSHIGKTNQSVRKTLSSHKEPHNAEALVQMFDFMRAPNF